jgi:hypothetical protein
VSETNSPEFQARLNERRHRRMDAIDRLPSDLRDLVHEYGYTVVKAHLDLGVRKAKHIRHLVETTLNEFSPTRGSSSLQGIHRAPGTDEP